MVAQLERILQSVEVCARACGGGGVEVGFYIVFIVGISRRLLRRRIRSRLLRLRGRVCFLLLRLRVKKVRAADREQEHYYDDADDGAHSAA